MIQVWITETSPFHNEKIFQRALTWVDDERLKKIRACRMTEDKVRSLCCGLLLQYALQSELQRLSMEVPQAKPCALADAGEREKAEQKQENSSRKLRFGYGANGKPYLADYPQFHYNLSHSGRYAAIAFADREVGIDIQQRRSIREALVRRVLSDAEYEHYTRLQNEKDREDWFFECWCVRESYGKLTGEGLLRELRETLPTNGIVCRAYRLAEDYYMHVCTVQAEDMEADTVFPQKAFDVTQELVQMIVTKYVPMHML